MSKTVSYHINIDDHCILVHKIPFPLFHYFSSIIRLQSLGSPVVNAQIFLRWLHCLGIGSKINVHEKLNFLAKHFFIFHEFKFFKLNKENKSLHCGLELLELCKRTMYWNCVVEPLELCTRTTGIVY